MSKKKRGRKPANAAAPAPQNKQKKQEPAQPAEKPQGERVIEELFGSLNEPDIENDIAELGADDTVEEPAPAPKKSSGKGFFFCFAIFVVAMAIVGCVSTVRFVADSTSALLDKTSLKNEFAQFIFPVVVNDIPPFEKASELPETSVINCSIWNILLNKDTELYQKSEQPGELTIPEYDVAASCRELFGSSVSVVHQTVGTNEVRFTYDEENHVYRATKNMRYLTYAPTIISMTEDNGLYTLIVGYLPPTLATVAGLNGIEQTPEKYMEYTIEYWDDKMTLVSVRFSDYSSTAE